MVLVLQFALQLVFAVWMQQLVLVLQLVSSGSGFAVWFQQFGFSIVFAVGFDFGKCFHSVFSFSDSRQFFVGFTSWLLVSAFRLGFSFRLLGFSCGSWLFQSHISILSSLFSTLVGQFGSAVFGIFSAVLGS